MYTDMNREAKNEVPLKTSNNNDIWSSEGNI